MTENAASQTVPSKQEPDVTTVRVPNMPSIYINSAGLAVGALDIRLYVGETTPNPDGKGVTNTQRLCIVMSPDFVKPLVDALLGGMKQFEAQFGKLRNVAEPESPASKESSET